MQKAGRRCIKLLEVVVTSRESTTKDAKLFQLLWNITKALHPKKKKKKRIEWLNHRLFISRLETVSFVLFFSSLFIFLEYADSSNQRDFFLLGSLALRICPIKSVEYA